MTITADNVVSRYALTSDDVAAARTADIAVLVLPTDIEGWGNHRHMVGQLRLYRRLPLGGFTTDDETSFGEPVRPDVRRHTVTVHVDGDPSIHTGWWADVTRLTRHTGMWPLLAQQILQPGVAMTADLTTLPGGTDALQVDLHGLGEWPRRLLLHTGPELQRPLSPRSDVGWFRLAMSDEPEAVVNGYLATDVDRLERRLLGPPSALLTYPVVPVADALTRDGRWTSGPIPASEDAEQVRRHYRQHLSRLLAPSTGKLPVRSRLQRRDDGRMQLHLTMR